ncbi:phage portal protein [Azospirillum argentinense]|uniref:Phage portal protein n=2 Tax=Azospirillum TaxID=191 RepID=A0A4D8Q3J8_AZOBR|nr:phage portal protein [Azospirillum argentinense]
MRTAKIRLRNKATGEYLPDVRMDAGPLSPPATTAYQGASTGRRMGGWRPSSIGPNAIVAAEGPELIRRARDMRRNNPHAKRGVSLYGTHIIGTGIKPRSLCSNKRVRDAIHRLWADWSDHADADGAFDIYGLQTQAVLETATTGEEFARLRARRSTDGLPVPLQVQLIPAEQVPLDYSVPNEGRQVVQGIERDGLSRRVAYWMYRQNPGDAGVVMDVNGWEKTRVDAADVCHMRFAPPNQLRGLPWLASAITTLHQLGQWRDAALLRKQMLASLVGFVRRAVTEEMDAAKIAEMWGAVQEEFGELPAVGLEPGTMQYLNPGEDVTFTQWQETAGQDEVFERTALRTTAAGLDLVYEELSGDWEKTNDRTFRAAFNTMKRTVAQLQHQMVAFQFCRPIWNRWIDAAVASGALRVPKSVTEADLKRVEWQPQDWEYLQPVQDVEAKLKAIAGGLDSRSSTIARRGDDAEVIDDQRAADAERERAKGIVPAAPTVPPAAPQPKPEDEETGS